MTAEPIPEALAAILEANGYVAVRRLPTGEIAGVQQFLFTGIVVGLTETGWRTRFCYDRALNAILPDGLTVSQHVRHKIAQAYNGGPMPPLLPSP